MTVQTIVLPSGSCGSGQAVQRAFLLQELKRTNEAEELLLQAAAAEPYYFQTYGLLASLWAATGRTPRPDGAGAPS